MVDSVQSQPTGLPVLHFTQGPALANRGRLRYQDLPEPSFIQNTIHGDTFNPQESLNFNPLESVNFQDTTTQKDWEIKAKLIEVKWKKLRMKNRNLEEECATL